MISQLLSKRRHLFSQNPFVHSLFTADPSARVWEDGRLYIYPSHDVEPAFGCDRMDHYHTYSTTDGVNWRDEGELLSSSDVSWGRPSGGFMWAPDCLYKNGHYYFFFPHPSEEDWNNSWKIGVAVSTQPCQGFEVIGYVNGVGGFGMIDPMLFTDDDGTDYLFYGGAGTPRYCRLSDDLLVAFDDREVLGLHDFHEACWVFKRKDLYYLTYSDNHPGNNRLCYATATSIEGPWAYQGIYLQSTGCETSHGSVVEYQGQWLAFYHTNQLSGSGNLRSICWDPLTFNPDGSIAMVVQSRMGHLALTTLESPSEPDLQFADFTQASLHGNLQREILGEGLQITGFQSEQQSMTVKNIDGYRSGKVNIGIHYATVEQLAKCQILINGQFQTLVNLPFTGSLENFDGYSNVTLQMQPGMTNEIKIQGSQGSFSLGLLTFEDYGD